MCWYVGNWQSILVQKDNWIFSLKSYLANYTPLNGLDANALVVDLINQDPKWYNVPFVVVNFSFS